MRNSQLYILLLPFWTVNELKLLTMLVLKEKKDDINRIHQIKS